jgi:hypothetical protein
MIKFRQKQYVLQESHQRLEDSQKFLPSPELENIYGKCKVEIERNEEYERQYQNTTYRSIIKKLVIDLKHWYLYSDGPAGGETHYLSEFSRLGKFLTFSKTINYNDRLNYRIYPPQVENGVYKIRVVLINCIGHQISGIGTYSENYT